jgi:hypothetical protein
MRASFADAEDSMTRYSSLRVVAVAVAGVFAGWPTAAQAPADRSGTAVLATPPSLVTEHRQLRDDVARAAADRGAVGDAARTIEHLLAPHLQHEEEVVLTPIGLVPALAEGFPPADSARALAVVEQVERELPRLLTEHRALLDAAKRLQDAATRENKPEFVGLAERVRLHAVVADQVLYPTTMLVGRYLKVQRVGKSASTR